MIPRQPVTIVNSSAASQHQLVEKYMNFLLLRRVCKPMYRLRRLPIAQRHPDRLGGYP
jgi:hypothetical protein